MRQLHQGIYARSRALNLLGLILFFTACSYGYADEISGGQNSSSSSSITPNADTNDPDELDLDVMLNGDVSADDLDKLLELADTDLSQISNVSVSTGQVDSHIQSGTLGVEVSTVTRTKSTVGKSPAAVFVITQEMIQRSSARTIPDLLRMVPGIQVARITSSSWAVSLRGVHGQFTDGLQIQVDGRSIYNSMFGGVYWEWQDIVFEDIERIEVVRGPGASVWGANAVNGIINIIMKDSAKTKGTYLKMGTGSRERGFANASTSGNFSDSLTYRLYGTWFERETGYLPDVIPHDDLNLMTGGFRTDWRPDDENHVILEAGILQGHKGTLASRATPTFPYVNQLIEDTQAQGYHVLSRWTHTYSDENEWSVQGYFNMLDNTNHPSSVRLNTNTIELDFQQRLQLNERNLFVYGANYRLADTELSYDPFYLGNMPRDNQFQNFGGFLQDQYQLVEDRWLFVLGTKLSSNSFTGFEYQPSARLLFTPNETDTAWVAVSRAVTLPAVTDRYIQVIQATPLPGVPLFPLLRGSTTLTGSESVLAYEAGYRSQPIPEFMWDLAVFYNQYDNVVGLTDPVFLPNPNVPGGTYAAVDIRNGGSRQSYGFELFSEIELAEWWKLRSSYTFLQVNSSMRDNGAAPNNNLYMQSSFDLTDRLLFDLTWRYVDNIPSLNVPSYNTMDVRLSWRPNENMEWAIVGRQAINGSHFEFFQPELGYQITEVPPEVYATFTWRFQ